MGIWLTFVICNSKLRENKKTAELIKTANLLFNSFEPYYMWDYIARWFEECCRCVCLNISKLPPSNVGEHLILKVTSNMALFQEDGEWQHSCPTSCWEFRSSRVLIGGVLSAGRFSVRYCFLGKFLSFFVHLSVCSISSIPSFPFWLFLFLGPVSFYDQFLYYCPHFSQWFS